MATCYGIGDEEQIKILACLTEGKLMILLLCEAQRFQMECAGFHLQSRVSPGGSRK